MELMSLSPIVYMEIMGVDRPDRTYKIIVSVEVGVPPVWFFGRLHYIVIFGKNPPSTLPPINMEVKNGCIANRIVTFQIVRHFPHP